MKLEQIRNGLFDILGEKTEGIVAYADLAAMFAEHGRLERSWVRSQIKLLVEIGWLEAIQGENYKVLAETVFAEPKTHTDRYE